MVTLQEVKQSNTETVEVISFEQSFSINEIQSVICEHGESFTLSLNSTWSVLSEYPIYSLSEQSFLMLFRFMYRRTVHI